MTKYFLYLLNKDITYTIRKKSNEKFGIEKKKDFLLFLTYIFKLFLSFLKFSSRQENNLFLWGQAWCVSLFFLGLPLWFEYFLFITSHLFFGLWPMQTEKYLFRANEEGKWRSSRTQKASAARCDVSYFPCASAFA